MRALLILIVSLRLMSVSAQDDLLRRGNKAYNEKSYEKAYVLFEQALQQRDPDLDSLNQLHYHVLMLQCLVPQGFYQETINRASQLLSTSANPNFDSLSNANLLLLQGESYLNIGRNSEALAALKNAELLFGSTESDGLSSCYNLLGVTYWNNQNRNLALQYHNQALEQRIAVFGKESVETADSYNNIGLLYVDFDNQKSIGYFEKSLSIYTNTLGNINSKVGYVLLNMSKVKGNQSWYDEAIALHARAADIWDQLYTDDHPTKAYTKIVRAQLYQARRQYTEAKTAYNEALIIYLRIFGNKHPEVANTYFSIGQVQQEESLFSEALSSFQHAIYANLRGQSYQKPPALPAIKNYLNADYLLAALVAKAKVLEALHFEKTLKARELKNAIYTYQQADTLVSSIRTLRESESDKIRLGELANLIYENGIKLALVLDDLPMFYRGYNEVAFNFCERSKAAILLSSIQESEAKDFAGLPAAVLFKEDSLKKDIAYLQQLQAKGNSSVETERRLFETEKEYRALLQVMEKDYPAYYDLKHSSSLITLSNLQKVISPNEMVISYFEGTEEIFIFNITSNKLEISRKPKPDNWEKIIHGFRNAIYFRLEDYHKTFSQQLETILLDELPNQRVSSLVIIPAGQLFQVPFEAIKLQKDSTYLIQKYAVSYTYAATLWAKKSTSNVTQSGGMLSIAPIDFSSHSEKLTNLNGTGKEVSDIKILFSLKNIAYDTYKGEQASELIFKETDLQQYEYLHFATHGEVNMSNPALSRIFLLPSENEDGSLYTGELYGLKLNAKLVCLSACETGLGKLATGEGILGLSRALLYAGSSNLIVSQWKVADESTAKLMTDFYENLLSSNATNSNLSGALRQAKLDLLATKAYSDPYYWAPFILIGSH
jgi:CHAT domain-containing protein